MCIHTPGTCGFGGACALLEHCLHLLLVLPNSQSAAERTCNNLKGLNGLLRAVDETAIVHLLAESQDHALVLTVLCCHTRSIPLNPHRFRGCLLLGHVRHPLLVPLSRGPNSLSSENGTSKTVEARLWLQISGNRPATPTP